MEREPPVLGNKEEEEEEKETKNLDANPLEETETNETPTSTTTETHQIQQPKPNHPVSKLPPLIDSPKEDDRQHRKAHLGGQRERVRTVKLSSLSITQRFVISISLMFHVASAILVTLAVPGWSKYGWLSLLSLTGTASVFLVTGFRKSLNKSYIFCRKCLYSIFRLWTFVKLRLSNCGPKTTWIKKACGKITCVNNFKSVLRKVGRYLGLLKPAKVTEEKDSSKERSEGDACISVTSSSTSSNSD